MSQPLIGQQFGNYHLVRRLGGGGFADVYLGQHVRISSQQAAIKILHLSSVDEQQFMQEAERTASLRHPHIIQLYDFDIQQGTPFLVLEYAPNGSLAKHKGQRLPFGAIVQYVQQIAPALQYAHDNNVIHRDIKPSNILVNVHGGLLVGDFGIAMLAKTGNTSLQSASNVGGTPTHMAPEMFRGKPQKASDQYSLGVMVYSWLCGKPPFSEGDFIELGYQHTHEPVPSLRAQNPLVSAEVEEVVMLALSKDPKQRFGSIGAFARALEEAIQPKPPQVATRQLSSQPLDQHPQQPSVSLTIPAEPIKQATPNSITHTPPVSPTSGPPVPVASTPPLQRVTLPSGRSQRLPPGKYVLLIGSVLLVLLLGSTGIFYWKTNANRLALSPAQATATAAADAYNTAVAANGIMYGFDAAHTRSNPYEQVLNTSNVSRLTRMWAYPNIGAVSTSLVVVNNVIYFGSYDNSLYALDAQSRSVLWSFAAKGPIYAAPVVVNGVVYVGSLGGFLYALDAHTGRELWSFANTHPIFSSAAVVNDVVYFGSYDGSLSAVDARSGTKLWSFPSGFWVDSSPVVVNGVVYFGSEDNSLYALDAHTGTKLWSFPTGDFTPSSPAVASGVVYFSSGDGKLYAFHLEE